MTATFVVEDGTGKTDANAFCTTAYVDQYNDDHEAKTAWSGASTSEKERHVRQATQYLVTLGRWRWRGERYTETQALAWPRTDIIDPDGYYIRSGSNATTPVLLKDATAELAIASAGGDSFFGAFDALVQSESISNEAKSESIVFVGSNMMGNTKRYPRVESMLIPLLHPGPLMETC